MGRRIAWGALVVVIVAGAIGATRLVSTAANSKGEMSITGKK